MERRNFIKLPALLPGLKFFKPTVPKSTIVPPIVEGDILIADAVPAWDILTPDNSSVGFVGMGTSTPAYPLHVCEADKEVAKIDKYIAEKLVGVS